MTDWLKALIEQIDAKTADLTHQLQQHVNDEQYSAVWKQLKSDYLGRKGYLRELYAELTDAELIDKPELGKKINQVKIHWQQLFDQHEQKSSDLTRKKIIEDLTKPGLRRPSGSWHPITVVFQRLFHLLQQLGFVLVDGPEIEDEFHNFTALNIPETHPARQMQDTFYLNQPGFLLRSHTSNVQIRRLQTVAPPHRMMSFGRVYRSESDATHTPMFHQIEGLVVEKNIHFGHLYWTLQQLLDGFFAKPQQLRFRSSYFPFTEPSAEVDIACYQCQTAGCRLCKQSGWIEVLGCGMVHPAVLAVGTEMDASYTGFAFGIGIERLAMLFYRIDDLRRFYEHDVQFLKSWPSLYLEEG